MKMQTGAGKYLVPARSVRLRSHLWRGDGYRTMCSKTDDYAGLPNFEFAEQPHPVARMCGRNSWKERRHEEGRRSAQGTAPVADAGATSTVPKSTGDHSA